MKNPFYIPKSYRQQEIVFSVEATDYHAGLLKNEKFESVMCVCNSDFILKIR